MPPLPFAPVLVTGGAGFIGSNIADRLAAQGRPVRILDALARPGVEANLAWLQSRHGRLIDPLIADIRDPAAVARALHGTDAYLPEDPVLRAHGIDETRPLSFYTPYGCSKGAADQYVLDYSRSYGIPACVMRMSCIYGPRQRGTEDQGWLAHFLYSVLAGRPISIYGDGRQVRDVMFVDDAVDAYLAAWSRIDQVSGHAFNLGGGPGNAVTLLQVLSELGDITGIQPDLRFSEWRPGDQRYFVADSGRATRALGLAPPVPWTDGLRRLAAWVRSEQRVLQPAGGAA